jgi:uncharacterized DUF497 family protein
MKISYDPAKREKPLSERGLDFALAGEVFAGHHFTAEDYRQSYGESRLVTIGSMQRRMVVVVWTQRGEVRRISSMRKANEREQERFAKHLG